MNESRKQKSKKNIRNIRRES